MAPGARMVLLFWNSIRFLQTVSARLELNGSPSDPRAFLILRFSYRFRPGMKERQYRSSSGASQSSEIKESDSCSLNVPVSAFTVRINDC